MAGASNRALKAAGLPKSAIKELRLSGSAGMSLRSAIGLAQERGIAIGDKPKAYLAKRESKAAASPAGQAAASDFRAKAAAGLKSVAERKAALQAARGALATRGALDVSRGMMANRKAEGAKLAAAAGDSSRVATGGASPRVTRALGDAARIARERIKTGMSHETRAAVEKIARERAAVTANASLADLAAGRRAFVKGKPVMVPYGDDAKKWRRETHIESFGQDSLRAQQDIQRAIAPHYKRDGVRDLASEERLLRAAKAAYAEAGKAEIRRRFRRG